MNGCLSKSLSTIETAVNINSDNSIGGFIVCPDVSHLGLGYVMMHHGHVVAYGSGQLKDHERIMPLMILNWQP